jgi:hypothetical protein
MCKGIFNYKCGRHGRLDVLCCGIGLVLFWEGIFRIGQNRIYTYIYTVYLVIPKPKIPYVHRTYMVLANPRHIQGIVLIETSSTGQDPSELRGHDDNMRSNLRTKYHVCIQYLLL